MNIQVHNHLNLDFFLGGGNERGEKAEIAQKKDKSFQVLGYSMNMTCRKFSITDFLIFRHKIFMKKTQ